MRASAFFVAQDFSEDTYRTLAAADNAVLLVDGAKGIEAQTRKLFAVARLRGLPVFTFVNKMDRCVARRALGGGVSPGAPPVSRVRAGAPPLSCARLHLPRLCLSRLDLSRLYQAALGPLRHARAHLPTRAHVFIRPLSRRASRVRAGASGRRRCHGRMHTDLPCRALVVIGPLSGLFATRACCRPRCRSAPCARRPALNGFEILEQLEKEFGLQSYPVNWPVGSGDRFVGVYHRPTNKARGAVLLCTAELPPHQVVLHRKRGAPDPFPYP
jgi:hypothetical protein